jgi:hypothetical protein
MTYAFMGCATLLPIAFFLGSVFFVIGDPVLVSR